MSIAENQAKEEGSMMGLKSANGNYLVQADKQICFRKDVAFKSRCIDKERKEPGLYKGT